MSHSVPPDSSSADARFLVGADLVQFDRYDLPIYATAGSLWGDAGSDVAAYGATLDRLYGSVDEVFVASFASTDEMVEIATPDDPLVITAGLADGLILPDCELRPSLDASSHAAPTADAATIYDFGGESHVVVPMHDGWGWDLAKPEWFYDHHV